MRADQLSNEVSPYHLKILLSITSMTVNQSCLDVSFPFSESQWAFIGDPPFSEQIMLRFV